MLGNDMRIKNFVFKENFLISNLFEQTEVYTSQIKKSNEKKFLYAKGWGLCKKTLEYALESNKYNEFTGMLHNFLSNNSITISDLSDYPQNPPITNAKGRPPTKWLKSFYENKKLAIDLLIYLVILKSNRVLSNKILKILNKMTVLKILN